MDGVLHYMSEIFTSSTTNCRTVHLRKDISCDFQKVPKIGSASCKVLIFAAIWKFHRIKNWFLRGIRFFQTNYCEHRMFSFGAPKYCYPVFYFEISRLQFVCYA